MSAVTRICEQPWNTINVGADGKVYPCCVAADDLVIGNLSESSLDEIITGARANNIRQQLITGKLQGSCVECHNASLGTLDAMEKMLNHWLPIWATNVEASLRVNTPTSTGTHIYSAGPLKKDVELLPDGEEIDIYSGFSHDAYIEGQLDLFNSFTIGFWISVMGSGPAQMLFHHAALKQEQWSGPAIEISIDEAGVVKAVLSEDGYFNSKSLIGPLIPQDAWTHIALSVSPEVAALFVDGKLKASTSLTSSINFTIPESVTRIGVNSLPKPANPFGGAIGGCFFQTEALSAETLRDIHLVEKAAFMGSPMGIWSKLAGFTSPSESP